MTKRFFTSLLLGFGGTLAVLVAISMPPGGWGVAVGVALGLLAALPLFLIVMALVKRPPSTASYYDSYRGSQPASSNVIIQQQLPQAQSMPLPPNVNPYNYAAYSEQEVNYTNDYADFYEPQYVAETLVDPRLLRGTRRRPTPEYMPIKRSRRQPPQNYYEYKEQAAYPIYQNQIETQYENWNNQAGYAANDDYYYANEEVIGEMVAPPDLAYYEEQQVRQHQTPRYNVRPSRQSEPNRAYRDFETNDPSQIVEAEYREIDGYGEDL